MLTTLNMSKPATTRLALLMYKLLENLDNRNSFSNSGIDSDPRPYPYCNISIRLFNKKKKNQIKECGYFFCHSSFIIQFVNNG